MNRTTVAASAAVCLSALGLAAPAHAELCKNLPNAVIVAGSTAVGGLLGKVAAKLNAAADADKITVVLAAQPSGSCGGVEALGKDVTPTGACATGACATGTANSYDATGKATVACDLDATTHIDLVLSDVYKESCPGDSAKNASLRDESLLVLPFGFITPPSSPQVAIDAKEAYYVFGKGGSGNVTPWNNNDQILRRNNGSGTQITIYKNLGIAINAPGGVDKMSTGGVRDGVAMSSNAATVGIIGLDQSDGYRSTVKALAYRHFGQTKFYYADSTANTYDKKNVRDGHYPLWGYEHGVYLVDGAGAPVKPLAKKLADILAGKVALPGGNMIAENAAASTIPLCAMDVQRTADAADYTAVSTGDSCSCLYEKSVVQGTTACTVCQADSGCAAGQKCHNNYCEAR